MLLFLDQAEDSHADWVEAECDRRGAPYVRLCTEQFPQTLRLSVGVNQGELNGWLHLPTVDIPWSDITGVWYRRPGEVTPHPDMDEVYERFARMEAQETLDGLYRALWDRRWVSPPHQVRAANHKIHQLRLAHHVGFQTAPTLVTNDPGAARAFFEQCGGNMIYKTLRQVAIAYADGQARGIYTTRITRETLDEHLDSICYIPCLFQQLIPKQYELRVNVIGERVWTTAIYTQESAHTQMDWRPYTDDCRHAPAFLPPRLEAQCVALTQQMGLRMGNIDLIATPEGDYVFLEINPNGQWAWIEDVTGLPLATALVDELLGVDTLADHPYLKERSLDFEPNTAIKRLSAYR